MKRILIIDDETDICDLIAITLTRMGLDCDTSKSVSEAKQRLTQQPYALCLTDMRLPDGNGLDIIDFVQRQTQPTPIAMITAHGNMDTAITALKKGAFDFLSKPLDIQQLRQLVSAALKLEHADQQALKTDNVGNLIGNSKAANTLHQLIGRVARSQAPVFIHGESGTGKEVTARLIHNNSTRASKPFIAVNCGAIPSELVESEFFGHKKGSFTGANEDKQGLFQAADGGTLLLDEVADLPLTMQVKLLRAIQEKAVRPIGSSQEVKVDVRLLSATHKDLNALVANESFRSDLFYRINVIQINVPALRDRKEDLPALTQHFLTRGQADEAYTLSHDALTALEDYSFPGNIRELENILERAMALTEDSTIRSKDLQLGLHPAPQENGRPDNIQPAPPLASHAAEEINTTAFSLNEHGNLDDYLSIFEKQAIQQALETKRWNKTEAAKALGISLRSLRYRLKKLGIDD